VIHKRMPGYDASGVIATELRPKHGGRNHDDARTRAGQEAGIMGSRSAAYPTGSR
jgi:hypothetical protein